FTQDDISIIETSTRLHGLGAWKEILTLPYWPPPAEPDLYRPLASVFLAMQYVIGAGDVLVFRVVSCALYAAASVGVLAMCSRIVSRRAALVAALLFASHPVHVEVVTLA